MIRASPSFHMRRGSQDLARKRCNAVRADPIMPSKSYRFTLRDLNNKHDIKYKSIITKYDHCVLGDRLYSLVQDIINYKAMVILNINHHFPHL